ncbi:McrC family protein [Amycolatopsis echigonensis]|uniref:Restriction endonuclease n=1 Tax=Amycolatopsis echigonensis TaxID=2576905 RepID=A0A8E2B0L9_9PSEU|nr:restriction endonuclease [Amycolatopsis echigonensis]MBB2498765.1 restriction endonuclease [Amycolatopsis echigonensis]
MTVLELQEFGAELSALISDSEGQALAASRLVEAAPDPFNPGRWRVRAKNRVGVAKLRTAGGGSIELRITPKVSIARLLYLLGFSLSAKGWRTEDVQVAEDQELLPALARLYAAQADATLRQGLLKGYRSVDETSLVMRGRVRMSEQAGRRHGRLLPLEISHDEFTEDITENRILRTACERLLRIPGGIPYEVTSKLLRLRARLSEVTPFRRGSPMPGWHPSRLNMRYHVALRLADIVMRGASVDNQRGDVTVSGFLFDMARVFEDFVTTALRDSLSVCPGYSRSQAHHHLDENAEIRIIPDFVHYADDGTPLAVADAKYKAEKPEGFPDADLYQMLAYCTALGLPAGHLVYAKGAAEQASHQVKHAGITIHQHALDLELPPAELRQSMDKLARLVAPAI